MTTKLMGTLMLLIFVFISCDGSAIKSIRPQTDKDNIAGADTDAETDDAENDITNDNNVKPDDDSVINAVCGDGKVEGREVCEKEDVTNCVDINEKLYEGGKAKCLKDCSGWETVTCDEVFMECGNNIVEGIEECDGNTIECHDLNYDKYESGTATCGLNCDSWNESACVLYKPAVCGDGKVTGKEVCEKEDLLDCIEINFMLYESGKAKCLNDCTGWNTETCVEREVSDDDTACTDECSKINSVTCDGSKVMKCAYFGGCLKWIENKDCSTTSRSCSDGNTIGFGTATNDRENVFKGTFIEATSGATIYEYSMELGNTDGQPLIFAVYESDTSDGTYVPIATRSVDDPGTGKKMYSSGPIKKTGGLDLTVTAGKFYIFGVAWVNPMASYYATYDGFFTPYKSQATTFGKTLGGTAVENSYPLLATIPGTGKGLTNYNTFFNTGKTTTEICRCNDNCSTESALKCASNWIEECQADAYGCLDWHQDTDCGTMVCSQSTTPFQCVCDDKCTFGYKECDGSMLMNCKKDGNGCTYWNLEKDCEASSSTPYCGPEGESSAKCYKDPQPTQDYIAQSGVTFSTISSAYFKGMYVEADKNAVITGFKVHLQQPGASGVSVPFIIYEGSTESGAYSRIHRSVHTVGANGYYGPTGINIDVEEGKYYLLGIYMPLDTGYYYASSFGEAVEYNLKFGKSIGNESFATATEPVAAYTFGGSGTTSYRMWIESYLD